MRDGFIAPLFDLRPSVRRTVHLPLCSVHEGFIAPGFDLRFAALLIYSDVQFVKDSWVLCQFF